jgi:recombination protein RecA
VKITAKKNKVGSPYRIMEVDLLFDRGFNVQGDLLDSAASCGIVDRSGSWYSFGSERIGQGRDNAVEFIMNNGKVEEAVRLELQKKRDEQLAALAAE